MSKKKKIDKNKDKTVRSINNNIRSSIRKLNPILKGIVGKKVDIAIRDLQFSEKRITKDIRKTISSAVANADYVAYDTTIAANDSITLTLGITLETGAEISVGASDTNVTFQAYGTEIS